MLRVYLCNITLSLYMDFVTAALESLYQQRSRIDGAILALTGLVPKKRGRPPKWLAGVVAGKRTLQRRNHRKMQKKGAIIVSCNPRQRTTRVRCRECTEPPRTFKYRTRPAILDEMDITKMLVELRQERERIVDAIAVLERLAAGQGKRRGRPPKWTTKK